MSSAFYQTTGKMKGSVRDLKDMTEVLRGYTLGTEDAYFTNLEFTDGAEGEICFTADGPYGKFDRLNDVDVFREMAKSAPMSWFEAAIEGEDDWTQSELHCCLKDGVLKIETIVNNSEDDDQAYKEYVLGKIPYAKFVDMYGIEADSLAEEDYEDFINDLIIDCCENETSPIDVEYDAFSERLHDYGGEMTLDEEAYEVVREQAVKLEITPEYIFREENDHGVTESFMFDAITGQYIK